MIAHITLTVVVGREASAVRTPSYFVFHKATALLLLVLCLSGCDARKLQNDYDSTVNWCKYNIAESKKSAATESEFVPDLRPYEYALASLTTHEPEYFREPRIFLAKLVPSGTEPGIFVLWVSWLEYGHTVSGVEIKDDHGYSQRALGCYDPDDFRSQEPRLMRDYWVRIIIGENGERSADTVHCDSGHPPVTITMPREVLQRGKFRVALVTRESRQLEFHNVIVYLTRDKP